MTSCDSSSKKHESQLYCTGTLCDGLHTSCELRFVPSANLPPPVSKEQLGARVLAQERYEQIQVSYLNILKVYVDKDCLPFVHYCKLHWHKKTCSSTVQILVALLTLQIEFQTEWSPIRSVIIRVIKSDEFVAGV